MIDILLATVCTFVLSRLVQSATAYCSSMLFDSFPLTTSEEHWEAVPCVLGHQVRLIDRAVEVAGERNMPLATRVT